MEFKNAKEFKLFFDDKAIVCEQTSGMSVSAENIRVRCKDTGAFGKHLTNPDKTGQFTFTGAYLKDATGSQLSAFDIMEAVGTIAEAMWGDTVVGGDVYTSDAVLISAEITSDDGSEVVFSGTLEMDDSGPVLGTVPT
jgi:hypothetical protein